MIRSISNACGGGDAGRTLVPGTLRGYRTWQLLGRWAHLADGTLPLTSITRHHVRWSPRLTACCIPNHATTPGPWSAMPNADHHAPRMGCTCGIYGWYTPSDAKVVGGRVFGVVEASGLILMGEQGFRAETARITAVASRNRRVTNACERAGIAVYRRRRDLLNDYPPTDMSSLLGHTPAPPPRPPTLPGASVPWIPWLWFSLPSGHTAPIAA
jgi:hypothetical protein